MVDSGARGRRRLPFWLWLPLVVLALIVIAIVVDVLGESFGWPPWVENVIRGGSFGFMVVLGQPRITQAQRAAKERRRHRRKRQP